MSHHGHVYFDSCVLSPFHCSPAQVLPHRHFSGCFQSHVILIVFIHTHHCKLDPCCTLYRWSYTRYSVHYIATFLSQFSFLATFMNNFVPDCTLYVSAIYNIDHAIKVIDLHGFRITLTIYVCSIYIAKYIYIYIKLPRTVVDSFSSYQ